jgi:putative transposase
MLIMVTPTLSLDGARVKCVKVNPVAPPAKGMESRTVRRVYRFRLEPTPDEEQRLRQFAGARRFIWNWALQQRRDHYQQTGKTLPANELSARLTALKDQPETAWLREIDSQLLQQVLADLQRAFINFFERRARYPRFKSRKRDQARFRIPQRVMVADGRVQVPKIGRVRARLSQPVEGQTKSATFKQDTCRHWHVSLVAETQVPLVNLPLPDPEKAVGLDLGLKDAVVLSTGKREPAPRFFRRGERKLRRAQRTLSRRQKGSRNKAKARRQVARVHQHIANQRADFTHKLSTKLVQNHQAVCIEDLNVKGLARTKLSKSVHDAAMGGMRRLLEYKGQWYHTHVVVVDRFYPSTQLCRVCGFKNETLTLSDRTWQCPICGTVHDRDMNAALNIRDEGLRLLAVGYPERLNACGGAIRPPTGGRPRRSKNPTALAVWSVNGADWESPVHVDCVATGCTISVDGRTIMRDGQFTL